jgi:hypothetical protein
MGTNTLRYHAPQRPPTLYWRRRVLTLAAGLTALALISWGFSGALQGGSASGPVTHPPGPGAAGPGGGPAAPAASPGGRHRSRARQSAHPVVRPAYCSKRSIVLSLAATQASFGPSQAPAFTVSIVSTQSPACSFNVGPRFLQVVISKGGVPVWNSADCVRGPGVLVTALRRGIPTSVPLSWNLQTSSPGCPQPAAHVPPGLYTAAAQIGPISSNPVTLRIS